MFYSMILDIRQILIAFYKHGQGQIFITHEPYLMFYTNYEFHYFKYRVTLFITRFAPIVVN